MNPSAPKEPLKDRKETNLHKASDCTIQLRRKAISWK